MRMLMIAAAAAMGLAACATAVSDSLDRRGVDAKETLATRVGELRADVAAAKSAVDKAASLLAGVEGLDGPALARQLDFARAAGEDAALAAQDVRLSTDSMNAAAGRYFAKREQELSVWDADEETLRLAGGVLHEQRLAHRALDSALDAARLRLSPALSLYDAEVRTLRKTPTSAIAAKARAGERDKALAAAAGAATGLDDATKAADALLEALK